MDLSGPIHILDEIEFRPGQRATFLAALEKRYRPQAEALGLRLRSLWLDPPLDVAGVASRALIDWELDGVAAFWSWRQRGVANPDLAAFWSDAAPQIARRVRRYAGSLESAGLEPVAPEPESGRAQPVPGLSRSVCLIRLRPGVADEERAQLERALESAAGSAFASLGRNLPGTLFGSDYTWDLAGALASPLIEDLRCAAARRSFPSTTKSRSIRSPGAARARHRESRSSARCCCAWSRTLHRPVSPNSSACCF